MSKTSFLKSLIMKNDTDTEQPKVSPTVVNTPQGQVVPSSGTSVQGVADNKFIKKLKEFNLVI